MDEPTHAPVPEMEKWRRIFRMGLAPEISTAGLAALRMALITDDPHLIQGATVRVEDINSSIPSVSRPCLAACAIAFAGWMSEGLSSAYEVQGYFAAIVTRSRERVASEVWSPQWHHFTNWYDETPREQMRPLLLDEINWILAQREAGVLNTGEGDGRNKH